MHISVLPTSHIGKWSWLQLSCGLSELSVIGCTICLLLFIHLPVILKPLWRHSVKHGVPRQLPQIKGEMDEEAGEAAVWNRETSANHAPLAHTAANSLSCMQNQCQITGSTAGTHCSLTWCILEVVTIQRDDDLKPSADVTIIEM